MLQLLGLPLILAAWTLPALFLLILAGLFTYAIMRPLYVLWAAFVDASVHRLRARVLALAESMAARSYAYAERHSRDNR
jgi:hypothetical protein